MTKAEFTKGPWVVYVDDDAAQVKGYPCVASDDYTVVGNEGMFGCIDTDFANAHLIAAAPDLYEVAVDALKVVELLSDGDEKDGGLTQRLRAALAKARGEEPE